jgi:SHAQKYF class myb-like DNA-binding protein
MVDDDEDEEPDSVGDPTSFDKALVPVTVISAPVSLQPQANKNKSSKKKKPQPTVTMATAMTAMSGGPGTQGENTGRWTAEEHRLFLQGLEQHGKGWKKIASLIKSRTVVQIRTHAQKYFQKLAKARQNGEEGDISMEGRGGPSSVTSAGLVGAGTPNSKRRRQTTGTKRKAISSVVASATREGKKIQAAQIASGVPCPIPPLPAVAPALAPFIVPPPHSTTNASNPTVPITTSHGSISGPALEDSL